MQRLLAILLLVSATAAIPINDPHIVTTLKPTTDRIREHGYPAEEHIVETTDGYLVKMFRIPYSHILQNQNSVRPAVLIQHGLFSCSDAFIANGPNDALAFLLADQGYDVWLGNARGNTYSRNNTRLSVNNPRFWRFSWHEIGVYDIPAMIDYILTENKQESVHYVGHSQGTSAFFVLMSMRPEYNKKIRTSHMLAPIGYMNHMTDALVTNLAPYLGTRGIYSTLFESAEFLPRNDMFLLLLFNTCGENILYPKACQLVGMISGATEEVNTNRTALRIIAETHPAGSSTDQILHYIQEYSSGEFRQFDFGTKKNIKNYNQDYPPNYEVENISSEVHFYYSDSDSMAAVEDVLRLAERLPNVSLYQVPFPNWSHSDFNRGMQVKEMVNDRISGIMNEYESRGE